MKRLNRLFFLSIVCIFLSTIIWQSYKDSLLTVPENPVSSGNFPTAYLWKFKTPGKIRCDLISWSGLTAVGTSEKLYVIDISQGTSKFQYDFQIADTNCPKAWENWLVIPKTNGGVNVYSAQNMKNISWSDTYAQSEDDESNISNLAFAKDTLFTMHYNGILTAYNIQNGKNYWKVDTNIKNFSMSSDGNLLYSGEGKTLNAREGQNGNIFWTQEFESEIGEMKLDNDNKLWLEEYTKDDSLLIVYDTKSRKIFQSIELPKVKYIRQLFIEPEHVIILAEKLILIKKDTGEIIWEFDTGAKPLCLTVSRNYLFVLDDEMKIHQIMKTNGQAVGELTIQPYQPCPVFSNNVLIVQFSDDTVLGYSINE